MVRSVREVVMCAEMHIMCSVIVAAKLWFFWNWLVLHVVIQPDFTIFLFSGMLLGAVF